jgi:hypothetical protein
MTSFPISRVEPRAAILLSLVRAIVPGTAILLEMPHEPIGKGVEIRKEEKEGEKG